MRVNRDFVTLNSVVDGAIQGIRPPERLSVPQAAEKYRKLRNMGIYVGDWKNSKVPYMVEPMSLFNSSQYSSVVLVGPAQCGKTEMFLNWLLYTVVCDPMDMFLVNPTKELSNDFSRRRINRMHDITPAMQERMTSNKNDDNMSNKYYSNGVLLKLISPTATELSGRAVPRVFLTDYDRMDQNVDGEGTPHSLARGRITTFGRHGMLVSESSPSFPMDDPRWTPSTPHEGPNVMGIVGLYNEGDRRMWYWPCVNCDHAFIPDFNLLKWPKPTNRNFHEVSEQVWLECPYCQHPYYHEPRKGDPTPGKEQMNLRGFWMRDGERYVKKPDGSFAVEGDVAYSDAASFWLKGVAATFQTWPGLVRNWLRAEEDWMLTGDEEKLKTTTNVDQGNCWLPKALESERRPADLMARAKELGHKEVPHGVRFLLASVDVQKSYFDVQVHGIGQGGDMWVVDRFKVSISRRPDPEEEGQMKHVRPFTYKEDWKLLLEKVILKEYPLIDGSGRRMRITATISDAGGADLATSNAYEFWRWMFNGPQEEDYRDRKEYEHWDNLWYPDAHLRFQLFRGTGTEDAPRARFVYPDAETKDKSSGARGEIPVLYSNVTRIKDKLNAMLDRETVGMGRINFPKWLPKWFYKQLCVETKNMEKKGRWENLTKDRNESWDLFVMALTYLVSSVFDIEKVDWKNPPDWAMEWDENPMVYDPKHGSLDPDPQPVYDLESAKKRLT